jgi:hypothetical protein
LTFCAQPVDSDASIEHLLIRNPWLECHVLDWYDKIVASIHDIKDATLWCLHKLMHHEWRSSCWNKSCIRWILVYPHWRYLTMTMTKWPWPCTRDQWPWPNFLKSLIGWEISGGQTSFYTRYSIIKVTMNEHVTKWMRELHGIVHF